MNRLGLEEQKRLNSNVNTTDINTSSSKRFTFDHHRCCHSTIDYNYEDYICGFGAAIVNIYVTFPINKIIFRQMIHGQNVRTATAILRSEGIDRLYRGVAPPLIQRSLTLSLMFGTFGTYHSLLDRYADHILPSSYRFCLSAFLAGTTEAIMCPLERVQMLLQVIISKNL